VTYFHLIGAALLRRKLRTLFTLLSVTAAFVLFGMLDSARSAFENAGAGVPGAYRMLTYSRLSFGAPVPVSLYQRLQAVPGVLHASYASVFGGYFREPKNAVAVEAYEANYFNPELYPEWHISPEHRRAFRTTRTGALAGETLATKYQWKVGDRIPVQTNIVRKDGTSVWTFDLVGTYRIDNENMKMFESILYVNWDHFDEARLNDRGTVHWYGFKVADLNQADYVARSVDALSASSGNETRTQSEQAFVADFTKQIAHVGAIVPWVLGAVFFTLILLTGNVVAQSVRERLTEMAVLRSMGFSRVSVMALVLCEALALLLIGSILGLVIATIAVEHFRAVFAGAFPTSPVSSGVWFRGLLLAAFVGLLVGVPPAWRGMQLRIADALSGR